MTRSISVVIPCYNEEAIIERSFRRVKEALERECADYEIIIANDGSTDNSAPILQKIADSDPCCIFIDYSPNRGMGYACRRMYGVASKDIVIQMDADLSMDPGETIPIFLRELDTFHCVVGSRYMGLKADYPMRRRVASRGYYFLNRLLFSLPLKDTQSGFFGIQRFPLQLLKLCSDGFEIHVEMFAKLERSGYRIKEVPIRFVHQTDSGEVSILNSAPRMFVGSFRIWHSLR